MRSPSGSSATLVRRIARITVVILFFAWLVDYIDRLVITLALPPIGKELHLDNTEKGAILTVFFLAYAIFQIPGGLLADRIGARKITTFTMIIWSAFTALTGAAANYAMLLVVRFLFGAAEGMFPGASMKAISERTSGRNRMTANGIMLASNPLGAALAPLVAAPAIALVGWKHSFFYVAGLGIVMAAIIWIALPRVLPAGEGEERQSQESNGSGRDSLRLLSSGTMWKFTLMFFGFDVVSWGLVSWVPDYLVTQRGVSIVTTGIYASIPWFVGMISTVAGGVLFDRYFHERHRWIIVPTMIVTAIFLDLMVRSHTTAAFVTFESIAMFFMFVNFMPIFGLPLRLLPREVVGSGSALVNFGGQAGGFVAPLIMGFLADRLSFTAAFGFLVFGALLAAASSLWSPQTSEAFRDALGDKLAEMRSPRPEGHRQVQRQ